MTNGYGLVGYLVVFILGVTIGAAGVALMVRQTIDEATRALGHAVDRAQAALDTLEAAKFRNKEQQ